jgi:para-nitrobenzyl esterase
MAEDGAMTSEVRTGYGTLAGTDRAGVRVFQGIPYAAPPTGERRFAAPARPSPWDGRRDATRPGPACPQPTGGMSAGQGADFASLFGPGELAMSEDCLHLDVYAPSAGDGPWPVMVWIHGGAFRIGTGSSPLYDGSALARRGVVVVTLNYRLGPLGFLNLPEVGPRNVGLLDQIAALEWVRDEIAAFGGDPDQVTIFGESAGGKSVECLVASPRASGLFRRAIAQSTYDPPTDAAPAADAARKLLGALGAVDATGKVDRGAIERLDAGEIIAEMNRQTLEAMGSGGGILAALGGWSPVVDGDVLPQPPLDAFAGGAGSDVAMVIGTTRDEAGLFTAMMPVLASLEESALPGMLALLVDEAAGGFVDTYRESRGAGMAPIDVLVAAMTDRMFRQHSLRLAGARAAGGAPTWMYLFDWCSPEGGLGACHALELPFVFGTLESPLGRLAGTGPDADALAGVMQEAWTGFARAGDPSVPALAWPAYDLERRATAAFGPVVEVRDAPFEQEREAWAATTGSAHA